MQASCAMILAMELVYGGFAQIIAGMMEFRKGNTFGVAAFTSYGLFWVSFVLLLLLPEFGIATETPDVYMGWYLLSWGLLTLFMFFATPKVNKSLQFVFASLALLFILLAARDFTGSEQIGTLAGKA
ncbi:acetate uptake transporter [Endozoicomonas lisbonensis]|uniref:Succinate-acetate transporter protein n=2 Tax=Endozoicomonas lisbonensis TaxID=3120522 RepID=A0ABV2SK50_9GAMM